MPDKYPFLIIGAGPAGLAAAIAFGKGAVLIERNPLAGKKLLLSGSGQCNFTNCLSTPDFIKACGKAGAFLKSAVYQYGSDFFIELLANAGCPSFIREDGKVFPASLKAVHVRDALLKTALDSGARIVYETSVNSVMQNKAGFFVGSDRQQFQAGKLLIACGGASWQQTGSQGDGYRFATGLGHTVNPLKPALASVETDLYDSFVHCAGSSISSARVEFITQKGKSKARGDLLFTHRGLSGPVILNNSHLLSRGDVIRIHLVPEAEILIPELLRHNPQKLLINALKPLPLTEAMLNSILHKLGIYADTPVYQINKKQQNQLICFLQSADFTVKQVEGLETSMSSAGGVALKEIDSHCMESRLVNGLYFAGEMLDYALPTGGFNIQAAFCTGYLAGKQALSDSY